MSVLMPPITSLLSSIYKILGCPIRRVILDKARVENPYGLTHAAIKNLQYESIVISSGIIIANKWSDSYALIDYLAGHPCRIFQEFVRVFATQNGNWWKKPTVIK